MRSWKALMGKMIERIVNAERVEDIIAVFGSFDENIKRIEEAIAVSLGQVRDTRAKFKALIEAQEKRSEAAGEIEA